MCHRPAPSPRASFSIPGNLSLSNNGWGLFLRYPRAEGKDQPGRKGGFGSRDELPIVLLAGLGSLAISVKRSF